MTLSERFAELFSGRSDAYGSDFGSCVRQPVTVKVFERHLHGDQPIGIYPLTDTLTVKWGCTDIDLGYDKIALAKNLYRALKHLGITSWVERTRSKGYHIWVFVSDWTPAEDMRKALLVAHQLAGVPPTEVNPKQTSLDGLKGFGNYVRLPYPHGAADRQVVLDFLEDGIQGTPLQRDFFVSAALDRRNPASAIEAAANLYVPPPPPKAVRIERYSGGIDTPVRRLNGLAFTIFNDGPLEGKDRSSTLAQLAYLCADSGLSPGEALEVLADADRRWGKFSERPDCYQQLGRMIERAYG